MIAAALAATAPRADAQNAQSNDVPRAALETKLAFVVTGDRDVDAVSQAGLAGLTLFLAQRTALEPGDPIGLDISRDELAFYPLIYWPIVPGAARPSEQALKRIDAYMKQGGTVLFDTRDAVVAPPGAGGETRSPGMLELRKIIVLARHPRARTGAARSRLDQDLLSAARLSRPLQFRAALGRGPARGR